jgi:hypothetical protein
MPIPGGAVNVIGRDKDRILRRGRRKNFAFMEEHGWGLATLTPPISFLKVGGCGASARAQIPNALDAERKLANAL